MRGALLLGGCIVALAGIIRTEIMMPAVPDLPARRSLAAIPTIRVPRSAVADPIPAWATTILARPLLSADRRPSAAPNGVATSLPRLSGLITWPTGQAAIFQPGEKAKPLVLGKGQTVAGWTIQDITTTSLTLARGPDWLTLTPRAGTLPLAPPPTPPKVVASRWEAPAPSGVLRARWSNPQLQP